MERQQVSEDDTPLTEMERWNARRHHFSVAMAQLGADLKGAKSVSGAERSSGIWKVLSDDHNYTFLQSALPHLRDLQSEAVMVFNRDGQRKGDAEWNAGYSHFRVFLERLLSILEAFEEMKEYPPAVDAGVRSVHADLRNYLLSFQAYLRPEDQNWFGMHF